MPLLRLNKYIAQNSDYSRRTADKLIAEGKIQINNEAVPTLGAKVDPLKDKVSINGNPLTIVKKKIYIALNKPANYVTTCKDRHADQTILDLLPKKFNVFPVGRLDKNTEGLIILTNDGDFAYKLSHPKFQKEKEYYIKISGRLSELEIKQIQKGITLPMYKLSPAKVDQITSFSSYSTLHLIIREGKKRQIRELFKFLNHSVYFLKRLRIGNLEIKDLPKGKWRFLTPLEINNLIQK